MPKAHGRRGGYICVWGTSNREKVTDAEGSRLMSRTLRAGDSYRVPNRDGLVFVTGNAGGLAITVDGEPAPAIGGIGIVRKNVKLDPELLKEGRAWP